MTRSWGIASPAIVSRCGMVYLDNLRVGLFGDLQYMVNILFAEIEKIEKGQTPLPMYYNR